MGARFWTATPARKCPSRVRTFLRAIQKASAHDTGDSEKYNTLMHPDRERTPIAPQSARRLLTQAELVNNGLVAFGIVCLQIVEQAATLADQHEKAPA